MQLALGKGFIACSRLARAAILLVLLGLAFVLGSFYFIGPIIIGTGGSFRGLLSYLLGSLAVWHHTLLFMAALWFLQRSAAGLGQTEVEEQQLERNLSRSGWFLMLGAFAWATSRPLLLNSGWFAQLLVDQGLQYSVWTARHADNYVASAVIGLVGLLLVLISKVLREQASASDELRQIF